VDDVSSRQERLRVAASIGRDLLANGDTERWELFVKTSVTRHVEVAANRPPKVTEVDETGVAARTFRAGRAGFGAASGAAPEATRRAIEGAVGAEAATAFDPLPPTRLLGVSPSLAARPPTPDGWAAHVSSELAGALLRLSEGSMELRRSVLQEGAFSWLLTSSEEFVASHHGTTSSLLAEVQMRDRRAGVWREWFHIPDPEAFTPDNAAGRIVNRALLTRSRITTDSGLRDLILDPEVTAGGAGASVSSHAVQPGSSPRAAQLRRPAGITGSDPDRRPIGRDSADLGTVRRRGPPRTPHPAARRRCAASPSRLVSRCHRLRRNPSRGCPAAVLPRLPRERGRQPVGRPRSRDRPGPPSRGRRPRPVSPSTAGSCDARPRRRWLPNRRIGSLAPRPGGPRMAPRRGTPGQPVSVAAADRGGRHRPRLVPDRPGMRGCPLVARPATACCRIVIPAALPLVLRDQYCLTSPSSARKRRSRAPRSLGDRQSSCRDTPERPSPPAASPSQGCGVGVGGDVAGCCRCVGSPNAVSVGGVRLTLGRRRSLDSRGGSSRRDRHGRLLR
jgi:hypothetical protein